MRDDLRRDLAVDAALLARPLDDKGEDTTVSQHPADVVQRIKHDLAAKAFRDQHQWQWRTG